MTIYKTNLKENDYKSINLFSLIIIVIVILFFPCPVVLSASDGTVPGEFVIRLAPGAKTKALTNSSSKGYTLKPLSKLIYSKNSVSSENLERTYVLGTKDFNLSSNDILNAIGSQFVEYIEPDYIIELFDYPSDPLFKHQWYLQNSGQPYLAINRLPGDYNDEQVTKQGYPGFDIDLSLVYNNPSISTTRVVVAIIDTGVDTDHPDLAGRFWRNIDEVPGNNLDDDHNGFVDDTLGYDIALDDNNPSDFDGHGTHLAGIVAAAENSIGITGIAPQAEIMAVKIKPNTTTSVAAAGIAYAVNSGADIINISWGSFFESLVLKDALDFAVSNGVLVVVAVGNTGDNRRMYPAAFDNAFAVAASNSEGYITTFSSWGAHIDIVAPGRDILSLRASGTDMYAVSREPNVHIVGDDSLYYLSDGTSMSAPIVAGAAALIKGLHPELTLEELRQSLISGADDMIDPFNNGDTLIGPDTISGAGHINISNSLLSISRGGLYFVEPVPRNRYIDDITIKAAPTGGYSGGWVLEYSLDTSPLNWITLAASTQLPGDSILYRFFQTGINGHIILRLTDDNHYEQLLQVTVVSSNKLEILFPVEGGEYDYNIPITGNLFGPDLDSATLKYSINNGLPFPILTTSEEFFDEMLISWNASGITPDRYEIFLTGYFGNTVLADTVSFNIRSAFASGWPQNLTGRGGLSPVITDLDNDSTKEIIIATSQGLNVFKSDGTIAPGFPVLTDFNVRGVPAVYDIDRDGMNEILLVTDSGINSFNYDGSIVPGWPVRCYTGGGRGFGFPVPTITQLNPYEDSVIVFVNNIGDILAYNFDATPYFYSLEGWFASFNSNSTPATIFSGNNVTSTDLTGNGSNEVVVSYSPAGSRGGVAVFDARTGQPAFGQAAPNIITGSTIYGITLTDLNQDGLPEIIGTGTDTNSVKTIWIKTKGNRDLPGWPIKLPHMSLWSGWSPIVADLDLDGIPEIICSFYEFDIGTLYIYRSDGTPYKTADGSPEGEAFRLATIFGIPTVADLTGDELPEITFRSGYLIPGTGPERLHILNNRMEPIPGWPVVTPPTTAPIYFIPYAPLVDDLDNDGLVELILVSGYEVVYTWDFDASSKDGNNRGRLYMDNRNSSIFNGDKTVTGTENTLENLPVSFSLKPNYPNPFNPNTIISFTLPSRSNVTLDIFNVLGQRVIALINEELPAGDHQVQFDGSEFASGVYLYRLKAGENESTRKMVLVK